MVKADRKRKKRSPSPREKTPSPPPESSKSKGNVIEWSIEETNRERAKLGLKPLDIGNDTEKFEEGGSRNPTQIAATNVMKQRSEEVFREKLSTHKEKRKLEADLMRTKTLGEASSDEEDGAARWVRRSRKRAAEKEKQFNEMDETYSAPLPARKQPSSARYSSGDLSSLKIGHDASSFQEGKTTILTLADKSVLDEDDEDVLVNVNMIDDEKAKRNTELRKNKGLTKPEYDEATIDDEGVLHMPSILGKYDEEIDGVKKKSFRLESGGSYDTSDEQRFKQMISELKSKSISLEMPTMAKASEYLSQEEEEAKFKRKKRRVKRIKRATADDLVGDGKVEVKEEPEVISSGPSTAAGPAAAIGDDQDDMADLQNCLARHRRIRQLESVELPEEALNRRIQQHIETNQVGMEVDDEGEYRAERDGTIVMHSLAEFCQGIGDRPEDQVQQDSDEDEIEKFESQLTKKRQEEDSKEFGWTKQNNQRQQQPVLNDEPVLDFGIASALKFAEKKGYIDQPKERRMYGTMSHLEAKSYSIEDKRYDDLDVKSGRQRDRYSGPLTEFKEKTSYKPSFKLEYTDEHGRQMDEREAFRYLSHAFHGKGAGKKKTETRMKQDRADRHIGQGTSAETPLGTVNKMQSKMKSTGQAFLVLTGKTTTETKLSKTATSKG